MTFQDFCDLLLLFLLTSVEKKFVIVLCTFIVSGFVISIILFINNIWNYKKGKKTKNRVIIFGIIALFCGVPTVYISAMSLEMYSYYQVNGDFYYKIWYEFYNDDSVDFDLVGIISEKNKSGESYYVLRLMEPITFSKGEKKVKVREIQLIIDDKLETEFAHLDYELCNITGSVFFTSEKQHHTKVILVVEEIRPNG